MLLVINKKLSLIILLLFPAILLVFFGYFRYHQQAQPTLSWQIADKTFIIDPGHGGVFPGKVSATGTLEKEINLAIAQELHNLLKESGAQSLMTRVEDCDLVPQEEKENKLLLQQRADLKQRTTIAKQEEGDLFISIHCNSIPSPKWSGAQTFYSPTNEQGAILADCIQQSLIKQLKNTDRQALQRPDTFLFKNLEIPAVIVECGFLSNDQETALLLDPAYQKKVAYAIYCGIGDYLSLEQK